VVAAPPSPVDAPILWTVMITSLANAGWLGDVSLETRFAECGLPKASVVRTSKIATCDASVAQPLGRLPDDLWEKVRRRVCENLSY
jgi:hypothetical protein